MSLFSWFSRKRTEGPGPGFVVVHESLALTPDAQAKIARVLRNTARLLARIEEDPRRARALRSHIAQQRQALESVEI